MPPPEAVAQRLHPTVLDTGAVQLAHVYAQALYDASAKANQLETLLEEYQSLIRGVLDQNSLFEQALISSIISRKDKASLLRQVFEGRASGLLLNYLLVLNDHGRMELLRPVLGEIQAIQDRRAGRVPVEVRAASQLDAAQEQALRDRLVALTGGEPVIHSQVDPTLLGGLVVRVADTVYDLSVRTKLQRMREQIIQRCDHEIQSRRDQFSHPA